MSSPSTGLNSSRHSNTSSSTNSGGGDGSSNSNTNPSSTTTQSININDYVFSFEDILDEEEARSCFIEYLNDLSSFETLLFNNISGGGTATNNTTRIATVHRSSSPSTSPRTSSCSNNSNSSTGSSGGGSNSIVGGGGADPESHLHNYYYFLERLGELRIKKSRTNKLKLALQIYNDYINNDENCNNRETIIDIPHHLRERAMSIFSKLINDQHEYICPRRSSTSSSNNIPIITATITTTPKDAVTPNNRLVTPKSRVSINDNSSVICSNGIESSSTTTTKSPPLGSTTGDYLITVSNEIPQNLNEFDGNDVFSVGELNDDEDEDNNEDDSLLYQNNVHVVESVESNNTITIDDFFKDHSVFTEIEQHAMDTLKELCFPLFLKSDHFKKLLDSKHNTLLGQYLTKIATLKPVTHQNFIAFVQNLNITCITVHHFALLKYYMMNEDFWSKIHHGKNYQVFTSTENYRMDLNCSTSNNTPPQDLQGGQGGINFFKYEVIFPFNCQKVMKCLNDTENRKQYDKLLKHTERLAKIPKRSDTELASEIAQEVYRMKWPLKDRVFTFCVSSIYDSSSDTYFLCIKSVNTDLEKPIKDTVKGFSLVGWAFKPIDENSCKYCQFLGIDFRGQIPVKVIHQMLKFRAKNYAKEVLEFLKKSEKNGWKQNGPTTPIELMIENGPINLCAVEQ